MPLRLSGLTAAQVSAAVGQRLRRAVQDAQAARNTGITRNLAMRIAEIIEIAIDGRRTVTAVARTDPMNIDGRRLLLLLLQHQGGESASAADIAVGPGHMRHTSPCT